MYASKRSSYIAAIAILSSNAFASPAAIPRAVTESALGAWVSVDANGTAVTTITPVVTTISGVATTINAAPESLTATTTPTQVDSKPTPTTGAEVPTSTGGGSYLVCHNKDGDFAPFCKPDNGSAIYVGETYYVTWDVNFLSEKNSTVVIQGDYANVTDGGEQAFHSQFIQNSVGSATITVDSEWLQSKSSNNITLYLFPNNPSFDDPFRVTGPTLMVTHRPKEYYHQEPAKAPTGQSLYIALPTVFGFILLCLVGGFFWNRKTRKIGLGNVMGRRKGYGTGKSRSERLGLGKKKAGAIQLREQELTSGDQSNDGQAHAQPSRSHGRADSEALGSLAGSPTEERTNYFREEMKRQEKEQGRF